MFDYNYLNMSSSRFIYGLLFILIALSFFIAILYEFHMAKLRQAVKMNFSVSRMEYPFIKEYDEILIANNFKAFGCLVYDKEGTQVGKVVRMYYSGEDVILETALSDIEFANNILHLGKTKKIIAIPRFILGNGKVCQGIHSLTIFTSNNPYLFDTEVGSL